MALASSAASTRGFDLTAMTRSDGPEAARLHAEALPHGFFSSLGPRFLGAYLRTYQDDPNGVALVVREGSRLVGFVVGSTDTATRRAHVVRKHGLLLLRCGLLALLVRPRVALRFVRTRLFRYLVGLGAGLRRRPSAPTGPARRVAVLAHVAVSRDARGGGIGSALVNAFRLQAAAGGADRAVLVTLEGEHGAAAFYDRLDWRPMGSTDDREGVRWARYEADLP